MRPFFLALALGSALVIGCKSQTPGEREDASIPKADMHKVDPATLPQEALTPETLAATMDITIYPGAKTPDSMSQSPHRDDRGAMHYELVMTTDDAPEKVAKYYSDSLKLPVVKMGKNESIIGKTKNKKDLIILAGTEAGHTVIRAKAISYDRS